MNKILYLTVYSACLLASHGIPFGFETGSNPLFFTNVCDLSALHEEHKYIACKFYFVRNNAPNYYFLLVLVHLFIIIEFLLWTQELGIFFQLSLVLYLEKNKSYKLIMV